MISTIIEGSTIIARSQAVQQLQTTHHNLIHLEALNTSIGIAQIKELIVGLSLTSVMPRLVWIEQAHTLTLDGAGALLKILEEPPSNTTIVLTCPSAQLLLPTIRSRCQIITLTPLPSPPTMLKHLPTLKTYFPLTPGSKLAQLSTFPTERGALITYFEELLKELSLTVKKTHKIESLQILSRLAQNAFSTQVALNRNVNVTLALTHFLLHLPKTK